MKSLLVPPGGERIECKREVICGNGIPSSSARTVILWHIYYTAISASASASSSVVNPCHI